MTWHPSATTWRARIAWLWNLKSVWKQREFYIRKTIRTKRTREIYEINFLSSQTKGRDINKPWSLVRFHEQDAGKATCGSKARYSSGTFGFHYLKSRRKLGFWKKINGQITKARIFPKNNYRRAIVLGWSRWGFFTPPFVGAHFLAAFTRFPCKFSQLGFGCRVLCFDFRGSVVPLKCFFFFFLRFFLFYFNFEFFFFKGAKRCCFSSVNGSP